MTAQTLTKLVEAISVPHVVAFFLVLARLTPLFIVAPGFSSQMLIPRVRSVLAVGLAFGLTPLAARGQTFNTDLLAILPLLIENVLVGLALAYCVACVFAAIEGAGVLADSFAGFSFGQTVDPVSGNPGGALTNLYTMVGLVLFLVIGGDAWTLRGLTATFNAIPIGRSVLVKPMSGFVVSAFESVFVGAIEIVAPLMLALVISDIAFGMVSRVVPQLNVFAVGFPLKVGVALIVVGVSLPFVGGWMTSQLQDSVSTAVAALHI